MHGQQNVKFVDVFLLQTSCTPLCWGSYKTTNSHKPSYFLQTITLSPNSLASLGFTAIQPQLFFHVIAVCYPLPTHTVSPVPLLISKNKNQKGTRLQCVKTIVCVILLSGPLKDKLYRFVWSNDQIRNHPEHCFRIRLEFY